MLSNAFFNLHLDRDECAQIKSVEHRPFRADPLLHVNRWLTPPANFRKPSGSESALRRLEARDR